MVKVVWEAQPGAEIRTLYLLCIALGWLRGPPLIEITNVIATCLRSRYGHRAGSLVWPSLLGASD
jgi:hypothetical protein